ncbi:hypothetical protein HMPREF9520_03047 [Enterococcus faecalis TX1467]|nr:hypothetical protein HMPREF9520_03047 [Enterococcus faecalis TX1467]
MVNKGYKFDDDKKQMYFELKLSLGLLSDAYLDLGNGKMFYLIDPKLAPYVDKITFERSLMSDGIAEKRFYRNI